MMEQGQGNDGHAAAVTVKKGSQRGLFNNRNFLLLCAGQGTSLIGDQFYLIALPWLVLMLTGDSVSLGIVLALAGIPRAVFMLVGGALTDRFSSRNIMLASDIARLLLTACLAGLVLTGRAEMWMLYAFALAFGTFSGIFTPASTSIVPHIVRDEELQQANAITQGMAQLSVFIGPALAGALIAAFAGQASQASTQGTGIAFAIDALTFLVSVVTLWLMTPVSRPSAAKGDILGSIKEGIAYVVQNPTLRVIFIILALINFLFVGPFMVGVPVIASTRLPEGAAAFGLLMSAMGGGNLLGIILSGVIPRPRPAQLGYVFAGFICLFGAGIIVFGLAESTLVGCIVLALLGICNGYLSILLVTTLQKIAPMSMMGRLMSLAMLASTGLVPISQAIAGFIIKYSAEGMFVSIGLLFIAIALVSLMLPEVRNMGSIMKS